MPEHIYRACCTPFNEVNSHGDFLPKLHSTSHNSCKWKILMGKPLFNLLDWNIHCWCSPILTWYDISIERLSNSWKHWISCASLIPSWSRSNLSMNSSSVGKVNHGFFHEQLTFSGKMVDKNCDCTRWMSRLWSMEGSVLTFVVRC